MSYESTAEPIKIGYLMDFLLGDYPKEMYEDLTIPFDMVFQDAFDKGLIDRRVEIVYREVEGLPKGTVKNVIDAYEELVEEGCLLVFGPESAPASIIATSATMPLMPSSSAARSMPSTQSMILLSKPGRAFLTLTTTRS